MIRRIIYTVMFFAFSGQGGIAADDCAEDIQGVGSPSQDYTVLIVWAKTVDDASSFPAWAGNIPTTLTDFFEVMSYNQHTVATKVATDNGGFYVSDAGHTESYYKNQYQSGQGYIGPWGIFVEEILTKVENDKGAAYFDDVDLIAMMITDGGIGWYRPNINATGIAYLGVDYTTGNDKTFDAYSDGITNEFYHGESVTKYVICHEYGHFLGLSHRPYSYGTYSLMVQEKLNEAGETVTPMCIQNIIGCGWLDLGNSSRVETINSGDVTGLTLKPVRSTTGKVAAKVEISANEYFIINNHQQSTNAYDATYPANGLLVWHVYYSSGDLECAVALDPGTYGENFDHLDLDDDDPDYHGEGLASDFWRVSYENNFAPYTNPNTKTWSGSFTDIAIKTVDQSGNDLVIDILTDAEPGPPQNLAITNPNEDDENVELAWDANTEPDLDHYAIYRGYQDDGSSPVNWNSSPSATTSNTTWTDPFVKINRTASSSVHYRITAVDDADNESDYSNSVSTKSYQVPKSGALQLPEVIALHQNYPNPFNPETEIRFDLPEAAQVVLKIYNVLGEEVRTLVDNHMETGFHSVSWDGKDEAGKGLPSGVYLYRFSANSHNMNDKSFVAVKKLTLLR